MKLLKKHSPDFIKDVYHKTRGVYTALRHGFPARKMVVVGITGTKGKTSTANYVWSVLQNGGFKTGLISTAVFRIGDEMKLNPYHMTMPSPFLIQKKLNEMVARGVEIVVIEMTSEGMKQFRNTGIPVDIAIFTNLTPEHLPSHKNDFNVYKKAKSKLFTSFRKNQKELNGTFIPRTIIANTDDENAEYYLGFPADKKVTFGLKSGELRAQNIASTDTGVTFEVEKNTFNLSILGAFNVYNALPAIAVGKIFDIPIEKIKIGLNALITIPGRMEEISAGQDFTLLVDYAHEPVSINVVLEAALAMKKPHSKIIILFGCEGGGRDPRKREPMAKLSAEKADYVIVTNVDSYDDDPKAIIDSITPMVEKYGKVQGTDLFSIVDRGEGIRKALSLAHKDDIVLITGKGAEQTITANGKSLPWDERKIVRDLLLGHLHETLK